MLFQIHLSVCNGRVRGRDQNQTTSAIVGEPSMDLRALDRNGAARQLSADGSVTTAMRGISRSRRLFLEEREMVDRSAKRRKTTDQRLGTPGDLGLQCHEGYHCGIKCAPRRRFHALHKEHERPLACQRVAFSATITRCPRSTRSKSLL